MPAIIQYEKGYFWTLKQCDLFLLHSGSFFLSRQQCDRFPILSKIFLILFIGKEERENQEISLWPAYNNMYINIECRFYDNLNFYSTNIYT